jgi:hypothetical protein
MTFLVKNGAWAPLRFSNMLSRPATGITRMLVTRGEEADSILLGTTRSIAEQRALVGHAFQQRYGALLFPEQRTGSFRAERPSQEKSLHEFASDLV